MHTVFAKVSGVRYLILTTFMSILLFGISVPVPAQIQARIFLPEAAASTRATTPAAVSGCPNQGGSVDSITVPVNHSLNAVVEIASPAPRGGASFRLRSDNPALVTAGDRREGFLSIVTIPEGQTKSNQFTIFGVSVGQTRLRITGLTPGFDVVSTFPLGAWDVNKSGSGRDKKFLDANDPVKACRAPGASSLTSDATLQATCGTPVKGVASDGVNALLLRTASGLAGTACFEIVSTSSLDQGSIQTPVTVTEKPVPPLNHAFSYYRPPSFYGDSSQSRNVTVEFSFTPSIGKGNTSKLRADSSLEAALPAVLSDGSGGPKTVPGIPQDNQCGPGKPMKLDGAARRGAGAAFTAQLRAAASDSRVNIISPTAGSSFTHGDTMTIVVELTPPLTAANTVGVTLSGLKHVQATWTSGLRFTATFLIPPLVTGPLTITPDFTDQLGNVFIGAPIVVGVKPAAPPVSLAFQQHIFFRLFGDLCG